MPPASPCICCRRSARCSRSPFSTRHSAASMRRVSRRSSPACCSRRTGDNADMRRALLAAVIVSGSAAAFAQLENITRQDATTALRAALEKGSVAAVASLGRVDGFLGNPQVKIPLPESAQRAERMMRRVGMGKYVDELVVTMNRAAESAVPEEEKKIRKDPGGTGSSIIRKVFGALRY